MIKIDNTTLESLTAEAQALPRLRKNKNYHPVDADPLQRMLNAFEPGSYICPHKHQNPDKSEVFIILTGRMVVVQFDDEGEITDHEILDSSQGKYAVEIGPRIYHACYALEKGTVIYEIKHGPYNVADDKHFAPWAPREGEIGTSEFMQSVLKRLNIE